MNNLQAALKNTVEKQAEGFEIGEEHSFSPKFEKKMNRLIKTAPEKFPTKKKKFGIAILAATVAVLTLGAGAMAVNVNSGFSISSYKIDSKERTAFRKFTYEDTENSPKTIETVYTLTGLNNEYEYTFRTKDDDLKEVLTAYRRSREAELNDSMYYYKTLYLDQFTKETFKAEFLDAKYSVFDEFDYNGTTAYYMYYDCFYGRNAQFIWANKEYCFQLCGNFTKEEAIEYANSIKPYEKEILYNEKVKETP